MTSTRRMESIGPLVAAAAAICFLIFILGMLGFIQWPQ